MTISLVCFIGVIVGIHMATASLLMAWFYSGIKWYILEVAITLFPEFFAKRGLIKAWEELPHTSEGFSDFMILATTNSSLFFRGLADLLLCPICLSFHIGLWLTVILSFLTGPSLFLWIVGTLTAPIGSNILLGVWKKLSSNASDE